MSQSDLLNMLAAQQGSFVSDLKYTPCMRNTALSNLSRIRRNEYSLAQWQEAICYLTGNECIFKTIDEIKTFLQGELK